MNKKISTGAGIGAFFLLLIPFMAFADFGPKPSISVGIRYEGKMVTEPGVKARVMNCREKIGYDKVLNEILKLPGYNSFDWFQGCLETAPKFGFTEDDCLEMQYFREDSKDSITTSSYRGLSRNDFPKFVDEKKGCYWTVQTSPPVKTDCEMGNCNFSYSIPNEYKIAVYIPSLGKNFVSNMAIRKGIFGAYQLSLSPNGSGKLEENSITNILFTPAFLIALLTTIFIECLVAFGILAVYGLPKKRILTSIIVINLFSLPVAWYLFNQFPLLKFPMLAVTAAVEILIVFLEAILIFFVNKSMVSFSRSFSMSFLMNLLSYLAGALLMWIHII